MKRVLLLLPWILTSTAQAVEFKLASSISSSERVIVNQALEEVMKLVPEKFKIGLPSQVTIKVEALSGTQAMPINLCDVETDTKKQKIKQSFLYGKYSKLGNTLTLNTMVVKELGKGRINSPKIQCQHKSLYDQALATIIHELTHAYDWNLSKNVSSEREFLNIAGFKKSLLGTSRKNKEPMRSADTYEIKNLEEAFAVNMEYFTMDPEFQCRKPVMFGFFQKHFGLDPYPGRSCNINNTFMVTTPIGVIPSKIELERIYRIDYLQAESGSDISSGFGHSMFRIVICAPAHEDILTGTKVKATPFGPKCLEDRLHHLVVSYRADAADESLDYLKGFFGGYPSMLFMLSLPDVLQEYNKNELRDVISYPLNFTSREKTDFLHRIIEEHWNYRGSYRFVTNNCAVESLNLIKNQLTERKEAGNLNSTLLPKLTPNSFLNELIRAGIVNLQDPAIEHFESSAELLVNAFENSYGYKAKDLKDGKKALQNWVEKSTIESRKPYFDSLNYSLPTNGDSREQLKALKVKLTKSASFSVIEQQVARQKAGELKKKLGEYSSDKDLIKANPEMADFLKNSKLDRLSISTLARSGYGIPLENEIITPDQLDQKITNTSELIKDSEKFLIDLFPTEIKEFEEISQNLTVLNQFSRETRKEYKSKLENFMKSELKKKAKSSQGRNMLMKATLNEDDLVLVREFLGKDLVTPSEISNLKLKREILDSL